jgi:hypothetical protein
MVKIILSGLVVNLYKNISKISGLEKHIEKKIKSDPQKYIRLLFSNPIITAQAGDELVFTPNHLIGHSHPEGKEFLGKPTDKFSNFISIDDLINGKEIILNIGDSSTSGFDSNIVTENRNNPDNIQLPFFKYETYSDFLRDKLKEYIVLNSGVPAHTSLQGLRLLKNHVSELKKRKHKISYVTIYYGNNDCAWNGNIKDSEILPKEKDSFLDKVKEGIYNSTLSGKLLISYLNKKKVKKKNELNTRTALKEYENNIRQIVEYCLKENIKPILIQPVIPKFWKPGLRITAETEELKKIVEKEIKDIESKVDKYFTLGQKNAYHWLGLSIEDWKKGLELFEKKNYELANEYLNKAKEKDFITPRIKDSYIKVLEKIATEYNIPLIKTEVNANNSEEEKKLILDYCHPLPQLNEKISEGIISSMDHDFNLSKTKEDEIKSKNNPYNNLFNFFKKFLQLYISKSDNDRTPTSEGYTLY